MRVLIEKYPPVHERGVVTKKTVNTSLDEWKIGLSILEVNAVIFCIELNEPTDIRGHVATPLED